MRRLQVPVSPEELFGGEAGLSQDGPEGAGGKCFGGMDGNGNRPGMGGLDHLIVSAADPVQLAQRCPNLVDLLLGQGKMETVGFTGFEIPAEQVSSVLQGFFLSFPESADVV